MNAAAEATPAPVPAAEQTPERLAPVPLEVRGPATIYVRGMFNYRAHEVKDVSVHTEKYAQYQRALMVEFVPKGKRKRMVIQQTYRPELLILAGHGHPIPADAMEDKGGGCSMSRHVSQAPEWAAEFDAMITPYLAERPLLLLADYRGFDTQGR